MNTTHPHDDTPQSDRKFAPVPGAVPTPPPSAGEGTESVPATASTGSRQPTAGGEMVGSPGATPLHITEAHIALSGSGQAAHAVLFTGGADVAMISAIAPDGVVVAALDTIFAWHAGGERALKELKLVARAGEVKLALEAPITSGEDWDAVTALIGAIRLRGATKVTVLEAKDLARLIAEEDAEDRAELFVNALRDAKLLTGRRPANAVDRKAELAKKRAAFDVAGAKVDLEKRLIGVPIFNEDGSEQLRPLMSAAAYRRVTRTTFDDRNGGEDVAVSQDHDIEVSWFDHQGIPRSAVIKHVSEDDLPYPRRWLKRLPGGHGANIIVNDPRRNGATIAEAIRATDQELLEMRQGRKRTGWIELENTQDGFTGTEVGYLHVGGAITENGNTQFASSVLPGQEGTVYPDPWDVTPERERMVARNVFEAVMEMQRPIQFGAALGGAVHSLAGLGVRGMLNMWGPPGSGKTTCVAGIAGFAGIGYGFGGQLMSKFDGSPASLRRIGRGRHDNLVTVDDQRPKEDPKRQLDVLAAVDDMSRRGYEGGAAGFQVSVKVDDEWTNSPPDNSDVFFISAGEGRLPGSLSTKERVFEVELPAKVAYRSGDARRFKELLGKEVTPYHAACLIRWLAGMINAAGGLAPWRAFQLAAREQIELELRPLVNSTRFAEVGSVFVLGFRIWLDYVESIHAITAEERSELEAAFRTHLEENIVENEKAAEAGDVTWGDVITTLKQVLASGETYLIGDPRVNVSLELPVGADRRPPMGRCCEGRGGRENYVFINPVVALDALRKRFGNRIADTTALAKLFSPISYRRENRLTLQSKIHGNTIEGIAIPVSYWEHNAAEAADDSEFLGLEANT
ncbi:hypothetical protein ACFQ9V_00925 [Leifsonia sp. NPDC056665]|uniref:hypothetical protein n=1 Tax=Leifsonia sp. NPDC056665 TaxID=3345901 RepID=UPI0036CE22C5